MVEQKKFKSFAITVRPRNGLHGEYETRIVNWIKKQSYWVYNFEKEAEARHIHAQIFCESEKRLGDVQRVLKRIAIEVDPTWDAPSQRLLVQGVRVAYNDDFIDTYIRKDSEIPEEYYNCPADTSLYYPPPGEQQAVMDKKNAKDQFFHSLKVLFEENNPDYQPHQNTLKDVGYFVYNMMFVDKKVMVITDDRRRKQTIKALFHYLFPYHDSVSEYIFTAEDQASIKLIDQMNTEYSEIKDI